MAVGGGSPTGIELYVTFTNGDTLEIYRDTSSGFGTQVLVAEITGGSQYWRDNLSLDGVARYYRVRAKREGYTTTAYVNLGSPDSVAPVTFID